MISKCCQSNGLPLNLGKSILTGATLEMGRFSARSRRNWGSRRRRRGSHIVMNDCYAFLDRFGDEGEFLNSSEGSSLMGKGTKGLA